MPVCPQCDNRAFNSKEALLQHMKSSSAPHPFCSTCDRRFVSQTAYDAHMSAKHPPTYDCLMCNKSFHAPFALEDHYRGSQNHPNCVRCGRGFLDDPSREEHLRLAHPRVPCGPCGGIYFYEDALPQHYSDSSNHPSCLRCNKGFKDDSAYSEHISTTHPDLHCNTCKASFDSPEKTQMHFWTSPAHPKCDCCSMGFENEDVRESHDVLVHAAIPTKTTVPVGAVESIHNAEISTSPPQENISSPKITPLYSTGFSPLSPKTHIQRLMLGEGRIDSPDLQMQMNYSSPLTDVKPLFSPIGLPLPGGMIEELWTSRENAQVPASRAQQKAPDNGQAAGTIGATFVPGTKAVWPATSTTSQQVVPYVNRSPPSSSSNHPFLGNPASTSTNFSHVAPTFSPPRSYHEVQRPLLPSNYSANSAPTNFDSMRFGFRPRGGHHFASQPRPTEFHPRLYPGRVRQAIRDAALGQSSPPADATVGRTTEGSPSDSGLSNGDKIVGSPRYNDFEDNGVSLDGPSEFTRLNGTGTLMPDKVNWQELLGSSQETAELDRNQPDIYESSSPTPRGAASMTSIPIFFQDSDQPTTLQVQNLPTSPSLATASSPASSALGCSPSSTQQEPETRPTTASSNRTPSLNGFVCAVVTPSSECPSPSSPEVSSPIGLGILPVVSPLLATPIDNPPFDIFDIPEARYPLPDSPIPSPPLSPSPVTITLEVDLSPQQADVPAPSSLSPLTVSSEQSFATSPQDDLSEQLDTALPPLLSKSIQTTHTTSMIMSPLLTPTVPAVVHPNNPLHCRVCLAESCDDITASMCGHIFCNRCITDAVIKTNRCPVCMTPTLLYCLFRLDLAA